MNTFPGAGWIAVSLIFLIIIIAIFAPGSTLGYIDFWDDSTNISQRSGINLISGDLITVTATDDPANSRVNYNISTTPGTSNQILVTDSAGTSTEFTSDITPDSLTVVNTDSDIDWSLQNNGQNIISLQDSGSEGNNNVYISENKFSGSGRVQISAFDGVVPYDAVTPPPTTILSSAELMSSSTKYMSGLAVVFSKHSGSGHKFTSYLLLITGRSASGGSINIITSDTTSGGCALTFGFNAINWNIEATNNTSVDCDVGVTYWGIGAWQD